MNNKCEYFYKKKSMNCAVFIEKRKNINLKSMLLTLKPALDNIH